ncbi:MAG: S-adenosyl-L-homocysteine hydrolase [Sphingomonadales bacterium]|nr:S-adenosyl-L-homocysteine hydrolase [Sphingomonadales bacterium]
MTMLPRVATLVAALSLGWAIPASAAETSATNAAKLRRLDIMLMVTSLRCRSGDDNFQADFQAFESGHIAELNGAAKALRGDLVAHYGSRGADRELDRMSTTMANTYGNGHPWLGCRELKQATRLLADAQGVEPLLAVADELLQGDGAQSAGAPAAASAPTLAYAVEP